MKPYALLPLLALIAVPPVRADSNVDKLALDGTLDIAGAPVSLAELPDLMARSNRRYARRQLRWWRRNPSVTWFAIEPDPLPAILNHIKESAA